MQVSTNAPPRRCHGRGHGPRSIALSTEQHTERRCAYCGKPLVRKMIRHRKGRPPELESPKMFAKRRHCDAVCWRALLAERRGPAPLCMCGCGRPTRWKGHGKGYSQKAPDCNVHRRKPPHAPWIDTDPEFWAWFAGFTDGEGCFGVVKSHASSGQYPQPYFKITVRADERPILTEIMERLGCGRIKRHVPGAITSNLQITFEVTSLSDCERIIEVFTAHSLRAKKARDLAIWQEIVKEKATRGVTDRVWQLRDELMAVRQYDRALAEAGGAQ